jgi:hypothetical protein
MAQAQGDPVRLDDFALDRAADDPSHVEQLAPADDRVQGSPAPHERAIVAAPMPATPTTALPQISAKGQAPTQAQLSRAGAAPDETQAAVSSIADSRPQGVAHIGGHDRCDPQLVGEELARCQKILELRAQEFNAPAPPQLSAEQALLAEQRADDERPSRSPVTRLRLATRDDPDADLQSNQELAALYLGNQQSPAQQQAPQDATSESDASTLAQVLETLQIATSGGKGAP